MWMGSVLFWIKSFPPPAYIYQYFFPIWWNSLGRTGGCDCWISLGMVFELSKACLHPQLSLWLLLVVQEEVSDAASVACYFCLTIMDFLTLQILPTYIFKAKKAKLIRDSFSWSDVIQMLLFTLVCTGGKTTQIQMLLLGKDVSTLTLRADSYPEKTWDDLWMFPTPHSSLLEKLWISYPVFLKLSFESICDPCSCKIYS